MIIRIVLSALLLGVHGATPAAECRTPSGKACSSTASSHPVALDDRRTPMRAGDVYPGADRALFEALREARGAVVLLSDIRDAHDTPVSGSVGTGFLALTGCHVVTAAHVVTPARAGPEPLAARLDRKASPIGARVRVRSDWIGDRARAERTGIVVAAGDLHRTMFDDWAVVRLARPIDAQPFSLAATSTSVDVSSEPRRIIAAFHGDLTHRHGRTELHAEVCERMARRRTDSPVFGSTCTGAPGASGGPELVLESGSSALRVTGIILAADRNGIDQFFGARGVPEPLWPGRVAGLKLDTVAPRIIAAIEATPCAQ